MNSPIPLLVVAVFGAWIFWVNWKRDRVSRRIDDGLCHVCGYDIRYTRFRCPECGTLVPPRDEAEECFPLRDDWPATPIEPRKPEAGETPVVIRQTSILAEAKLIQEQLVARGVQCWFGQHQPNLLVPYQTKPPAECSVTVWSGDEELARELLEHLLTHRPRETEKSAAEQQS